jgi:hypothetical protein
MEQGYVTSAWVEFRETLARHIKELMKDTLEPASVEWYFLRYLRRLATLADATPHAHEVDGAMRALTRFYLDAVTQAPALAARFEEILAAHRYALRAARATP